MNKKTVAKYPMLCVIAESINFSKLVYRGIWVWPCVLFTKQRSTLNIECSDLWLKHTNLQTNICDLFNAYQTYSPPKKNQGLKDAFI